MRPARARAGLAGCATPGCRVASGSGALPALRVLMAASSAPQLSHPLAGRGSVVRIRVRRLDRPAVAQPIGPERREIDAAGRRARDQPGDPLADRWRDLEAHAGET